jgi:hypothetical protein
LSALSQQKNLLVDECPNFVCAFSARAIHAKNQQLFIQRSSIQKELVTVTNWEKNSKNDVAFIVFLRTEEKLDLLPIVTSKLLLIPIKKPLFQ